MPYLYQKANFKVFENDNTMHVAIPYNDKTTYFVIAMPKNDKGWCFMFNTNWQFSQIDDKTWEEWLVEICNFGIIVELQRIKDFSQNLTLIKNLFSIEKI